MGSDIVAQFAYDVIIIGSGFGGSVAALRAAEKGYRVGVMESGRHWRDEDIPKTQWDLPRFLWLPEAELYGIQRLEYLDDVLVLSGAGVGGGSHPCATSAGRRSLPVHADRRRSVRAAGRERDGGGTRVQQGPRWCVLRQPRVSKRKIRTSAESDHAGPDASRAAIVKRVAVITPRTK